VTDKVDYSAAIKASRRVLELNAGDLMRRTGMTNSEALKAKKVARAYLERFDKETTDG